MDKIDELLTRGVEKIYPSKEELEKVLRSGKKLKLYQGFDATTPLLHIGHFMGLMKLKQWQELGHEVIFLIGDFTGMIGDPTGKDKTRSILTKEQVAENAKTYKEQAGKILNFEGENAAKIMFNSEWLGKLGAIDLAKLMSIVTFSQIVERDMFQKRIKNNIDISMVEFIYPLLQGYDSVAMDVDLELGGNDQTFNMLIGRDLMKKLKSKEKFVMTTPLLTDSSGNKIGKTTGNAINLMSKPEDFYGQIMSLGDDVIVKCFEYLTDIPMEEVKKIETDLKSGANPMDFKKKLAFKLTEMLNSTSSAQKAQQFFESTVQNKETPTEIPEFKLTKPSNIIDVLVQSGLASSNSEAKRLIEQGAVEINSKKIYNNNEAIEQTSNLILKVGKRKYLKII